MLPLLTMLLTACGPDTADVVTDPPADTGADTGLDTGDSGIDSGVDSGTDSGIDTAPVDACATPSGALEMARTAMALTFTGTGTICEASCSALWVWIEVVEGDAAAALPHEVEGQARAWIRWTDPGAPATATCEVYTSAGVFPVEVVWGG